MKKVICSTYLKAKHLMISVKQFKQIHLMDEVVYKGKRCFINNGTRVNDKGETLWDVVEKEWNVDGTRNKYFVTSRELKRRLTLYNIKNALLSHYRWWHNCWYSIDLRKMLEK